MEGYCYCDFPAVCRKNECKAAEQGLCYWLTVWGWPTTRAGARSVLHALTDRIRCNKATSMSSVQIRVLSCIFAAPYHRLFLSLCVCFRLNISLSISLLLSFRPLSPSPSLSLSCWPDCCRALTEDKHSEIWHCIIMPQTCTYHSLAAPLLSSVETLTERSVGVADPTTAPVRRVLAVDAVWKPLGLKRWCSPPSHRRRTALKGCKNARCDGAVGVLFGPAVLCYLREDPWMWPQRRRVRAALEQHWFMRPFEGWLCISGAFTQSFVPSLRHRFTSSPVYTNTEQVHACTPVGERARKSIDCIKVRITGARTVLWV